MKRANEWKKRLFSVCRKAGSSLLDMLYPLKCPVCQNILSEKDERYCICSHCRGTLPYVTQPLCVRCGKPLRQAGQEYCRDCETHRHAFARGRSTFVYEGQLREAVVRMKFQNQRIYIPFFANEMVQRNRHFIQQIHPDALVPVPMHPRKKQERGFDQCLLLARETAALTGIVLADDILARSRYTAPQKGLSRQERQENLHGAFTASALQKPGGRILIIDDIYTTGATMDAAARALLKAGAEEVFFLTLCIGSDKEEG